jgi:hypothetical protein
MIGSSYDLDYHHRVTELRLAQVREAMLVREALAARRAERARRPRSIRRRFGVALISAGQRLAGEGV